MSYSVDKRSALGVFLICLIVIITGCATQKPIVLPKPGVIPPLSEQPQPESKQELRLSPARKLANDAEALITADQLPEALATYSMALESAEPDEKQNLLARIQAILFDADPGRVSGLQASDFSEEINALILYQQCQELALQHRDAEAIDQLLCFLQEYPDHFRAMDAQKLLRLLEGVDYHGDRIGCMLPLTGKFSVFGQMALKGVELAVRDLTQHLGKTVTVIIKDTQSDNDRAIQCVNELYNEKVAAIVGPIVTAEAAGPEAQKLKIPMIALTQKQLVAKKGGFVFTNFLRAEMQTRALVEYAFKSLGITRFAVLYPNDKYGETFMNLFWNDVEAVGGEIVGIETYARDQTDFSNVIKKLTGLYYPVPDFVKAMARNRQVDDLETNFRSFYLGQDLARDSGTQSNKSWDGLLLTPQSHPKTPNINAFDVDDLARTPGNLPALENQDVQDEEEKPIVDFQAIFIPDAPAKVSLILPQLAYHDVTGLYLLGPNIWHDDLLIRNAAGYIRKAVITEGYFPDSKREKAAQFSENFRHYYTAAPGFIEAVAYDSVSMITERALDPSVYCQRVLRNALANDTDFEGVTGRTRFDVNGNAQKDLFFLTVQKGRFVEIIR